VCLTPDTEAAGGREEKNFSGQQQLNQVGGHGTPNACVSGVLRPVHLQPARANIAIVLINGFVVNQVNRGSLFK